MPITEDKHDRKYICRNLTAKINYEKFFLNKFEKTNVDCFSQVISYDYTISMLSKVLVIEFFLIHVQSTLSYLLRRQNSHFLILSYL